MSTKLSILMYNECLNRCISTFCSSFLFFWTWFIVNRQITFQIHMCNSWRRCRCISYHVIIYVVIVAAFLGWTLWGSPSMCTHTPTCTNTGAVHNVIRLRVRQFSITPSCRQPHSAFGFIYWKLIAPSTAQGHLRDFHKFKSDKNHIIYKAFNIHTQKQTYQKNDHLQ